MGKRPSFQFYPGDWLRDTALRSCSVGARGLWIEMICLMHEGSPYGHLKVNLKPILTPNLARMAGATLPDTEGWLGELSDAGVYDLDGDGAIYSRRMVRDEEVRVKRAAGGVLGGNPALMKGKGKDNLPANLEPTPSSSSASSSAIASSSATASAKKAESPPPLLKGLPRFENDRKLCKGFDEKLSAWERAFKHVNIPGEIPKAHAWLIANNKTRKDHGRFLNNWFKTAEQDGEDKARKDPYYPTSEENERKRRERYKNNGNGN